MLSRTVLHAIDACDTLPVVLHTACSSTALLLLIATYC